LGYQGGSRGASPFLSLSLDGSGRQHLQEATGEVVVVVDVRSFEEFAGHGSGLPYAFAFKVGDGEVEESVFSLSLGDGAGFGCLAKEANRFYVVGPDADAPIGVDGELQGGAVIAAGLGFAEPKDGAAHFIG